MTAKHTPVPWTVRSTCIYTADEHKDWVASCGNGQVARQQINKANARLIAAAPELLEAAKLVLEWYEAEDDHSGTDFYQRMQMCRDSEDAIRAAIAKATGEQT